jgi:PAS domain S-box-containing protein
MFRKTENILMSKEQDYKELLQFIPSNAITSDSAQNDLQGLYPIFNAISEILFRLDGTGRLIDVNEGMAATTGYTVAEMKGKFIDEFLHPEENQVIAGLITGDCTRNNTIKNYKHRVKHRNGHWLWFNTSGHAFLNGATKVHTVVCISYDVTENIQHGEALKERQDKYQKLFFAHPLPLLVFDLDTFEMLDVNIGAEKQYGYTHEEFLQLSIKDIRPSEEVAAFVSKIEQERVRVIEEGQRLKGYWQHKKKNGELFFVEVDYYYMDFYGRRAGMACVRDITEKKKTEEQNRYLASIAESVSDAIYTCNMNLEIISWNHAAEEIYGVPAADAIGKTLSHFFQPYYETGSRDTVIKQVIETGTWKGEVSFQQPCKGNLITLLSSVSVLKDDHLQPSAYVITSKDISERKLAERIISESEMRFRTMADSAPVMIWVTNDKDQIIYYNQGWLDFTGKSMNEEIQQRWEDKIYPDDIAHAVKEYYQAIVHQQPFTVEYRLRKHDGTYSWVIDRGSPRFLEDGSFVGYTGVCFNIQDRKEMEAQLLQVELEKQKLISKAGIEGQENEREGISRELHDNVNQLISSAKLYMEVVKRDPDTREDMVNRSIETLNMAIEEIRRLSKSLTPPSLGNLGINDVIDEFVDDVNLIGNLQLNFQPCKQLEEHLSPEIALTVYRIVQEQVNNILKHAEAAIANIKLSLQNGILVIDICDNGKGFNPLARRKGVGITNITNRAALYNGQVSIESSPGNGCVLKVSIPLASPEKNEG